MIGRRLVWALAVSFVAASARAQAADSAAPSAADQIKDLQERLTRLEGAPAKTGLNAFNPAIGMAVDAAFRSEDARANFNFRAAELNVEAPVDPFLKAWAVITGSNGSPAVDIEEATLETTALPYNLTVRGGRLFADFGRMAHFHDHELPVIDRPASIDAFVGGETRADGVEVSYLFPMDAYLNATAGLYDKMGAENARQDPAGSRSLYEFTYMGRLHAYADVGENHSVDVGLSSAWTPKRVVSAAAAATPSSAITSVGTERTLTELDVTYRYAPVRGGLYHGVIWGTEVLQNDEQRFDSGTLLPTRRVHAYSGFTYVQVKMGQRWRPGAMADLTEDLDESRRLTQTYTAFLTCDVTEFQRLRATYSRALNNVPGQPHSDVIGLQWTGVFGHHVHGFRDR